MASITASPGFFFSAPVSAKDEGKKTLRSNSIENPLLGRDAPPLRSDAPAIQPRHDGLRQRNIVRFENDSFENKENASNSVSHSLKAPPPPRASVSLGMGVDLPLSKNRMSLNAARNPASISSTSVPSTSGCWILIFGYVTQSHYDELLQRFFSYGHVLNQRGSCQPGQSNWIALQYANQFEAEKALGHNPVKLGDGIVCGVTRLADDDPILLHSNQFTKTSDIWKGTERTPILSGGSSTILFANTGGLREKDILHQGSDRSSPSRNICERLLRWILHVHDD